MSNTGKRDIKVNERVVSPKWVTSLSVNGEPLEDAELQAIFDEIDRTMGNIENIEDEIGMNSNNSKSHPLAKYQMVSVNDRFPDLYKWVTTIDEDGEHRVYRLTEHGLNMRDLDGVNSPNNNKKIQYWLEELHDDKSIEREATDEELIEFLTDAYDRCKSENNLSYFSDEILNPIMDAWRLEYTLNNIEIIKHLLLKYSDLMSTKNLISIYSDYILLNSDEFKMDTNLMEIKYDGKDFKLNFNQDNVAPIDNGFGVTFDGTDFIKSDRNMTSESKLCEKMDEIEIKNEYDVINKAKHYNSEVFPEVIEMMITTFGIEETKSFCKLNAFKYRMRCGNKDNNSIEQDINKAIWYENKFKELSK